MNQQMLRNDLLKFNFLPDDELTRNGFNMDVKKELYRYPSLFLLNICIVLNVKAKTSWAALEQLIQQKSLSKDMGNCLKFSLATAVYTRLSAYLHHKSQNERISVGEQMSLASSAATHSTKSHWALSCSVFSRMCVMLIQLKSRLKQNFKVDDLSHVVFNMDERWLNVITLLFSGRYQAVLQALIDLVGEDKLHQTPFQVVRQSTDDHHLDLVMITHVVSNTLFLCEQYDACAALVETALNGDVSASPSLLALCYLSLGYLKKAKAFIERFLKTKTSTQRR